MNYQRTHRTVVVCALLLIAGLPMQTSAQSDSPRIDEPYGNWEVKTNLNGRQRTSILSLSSDPKNNQSGQWIGLEGMSELEDVKYEAGKLSFKGKSPNRVGQSTTWKFKGRIKKDKLTGTVSSSDRGEQTLEGTRIPPTPDVVGNYGFSYSKDGTTLTLALEVNSEGELTAKWLTLGGDIPITDLTYEGGKLTFQSKLGRYEGSLTQQKSLNGTYTTDSGREYSVLSLRLGTPMIGTWNLEVTSEQGSRKQRLKVNPDMSGWYGPVPIKRIDLKGDDPLRPNQPRAVRFKAVMKSGKRKVEVSFSGKVTKSKLTGEITTSTSTAKVVGRKVAQCLDKKVSGTF